ncbi:MAG: LL-diaminopimelate aminotransferase [Elusimicrobia bacterium]|nr:LL-diaminopimelate aminotransferase [Elusimicrobiota bacterium]
MKLSTRLQSLPPYPFAEIDRKKKKAVSEGRDIISLGVGDPDLPTPQHIVEAGKKGLENPKCHQYPFGAGTEDFRNAVADWYRKRFQVALDPTREIHACIGSKDGLSHLHFALINAGDTVLIPSPGYPVYNTSTIFTDGSPFFLPLRKENRFLPDLDSIPEKVLSKSKLLFLNSPNNPTASVADASYFEKAVALAKKYGFLIAHDAAYSEIYFEQPPISFLSVPGAKEVGVEFHSCSKTYNMTGWRVGWFCGNADLVSAVGRVKDNFDSGVFEAVQRAAISALSGDQICVSEMRKVYRERRDVLVPGLKKLGWNVETPQATFYVWAESPKGFSSAQTIEKLIEEASLIATPGTAFGKEGEGYIRFALTTPKEKIQVALDRLSKIRW